MYLWIKHWWQFSHKIFIVKLSPWRYWLQRKWQQWNPTWNGNILFFFSWTIVWYIYEEENLPVLYDKEDNHDENRDQNTSVGTFQKGKNINVITWVRPIENFTKRQKCKTRKLKFPFGDQNTITRKSPGKDAEDAFFHGNTATGFFDLWFSGDFVNAGFQLDLYLEGRGQRIDPQKVKNAPHIFRHT